MTSSDNETWTGTFTPTSNIEDATNRLSLGTNYTDLAGNNGLAEQTANYEVDTIRPSVDNFTMSDTELKIGDNATVTITFSETVTNFTNTDISIATLDNGTASGSLSTMTPSNDNKTWTGTFIPTDDAEDNTSVLSLRKERYTDLAGNIGAADNETANYEIDTREPVVSSIAITGQEGRQNNFLNPGDNVSFTATFSETVILDNRSGFPQINTIVVGSANREATYTSGSNSDNLTFRYTIKSLNFSGENDTDGISLSLIHI